VVNANPNEASREDIFDAVIVCVGTCGVPSKPDLPGIDNFRGPVLHSSELDGKKAQGVDWENKRVLVVGGGASAVEAVEAALDNGAHWSGVSARDDKVHQFS
jgi:cation diffusion facilitator CzcD-associated flavoprotein CzcO